MTYDNEAIVRQAYHAAEGTVMDVARFVGSFAGDGVINPGALRGWRGCRQRRRHGRDARPRVGGRSARGRAQTSSVHVWRQLEAIETAS